MDRWMPAWWVNRLTTREGSLWLSTAVVTSVGMAVPSLRVWFTRNGIACKNTGKDGIRPWFWAYKSCVGCSRDEAADGEAADRKPAGFQEWGPMAFEKLNGTMHARLTLYPLPVSASIFISSSQKLGQIVSEILLGHHQHLPAPTKLQHSDIIRYADQQLPQEAARPTSPLTDSQPYSRRRRTERSHRPKMEITVLTGLPVSTTAKKNGDERVLDLASSIPLSGFSTNRLVSSIDQKPRP